MNEKEYKENVKYETFEQFWDDNYGKEYGYSDKNPLEPYYSIASYSWEMGENHGYYLGKDYGDINKGDFDMQVYVVSSGEYSDYGINAIFSTLKKAQEYVSMREFADENEYYRINVWEVDEHYETEIVNLVLMNNEIYNYDYLKFQIDWLYNEFDGCADRVIEITKDWLVDYFKKDFGYGSENFEYFKFDDKIIKFPIYIVKGIMYNPNKDVMKKVVYDSIAKYKAEKEGI